MRLLADFITSPLNIFWVLIAFSAGLYFFKKKRPARIMGIVALVLLFITASDPLPDLLIRSLESRYPPLLTSPFTKDDTLVNILVLGSGNIPDPSLTSLDQLSDHSLERLAEGIRIYRMLPGSRLITSGFSRNGQKTQAAVSADAARSLGVAASDISMMEKPANTAAEATEYRKNFGPGAKLILVTNAFHMPRAMQLFKEQGLNPVPAPTGHILKREPGGNQLDWFSSEENFNKMEIALHEYIGMAWGKG